MMFKTAALIAAIDAALERYEARAEEYATAHAGAVEKHRAKWLRENTELWRKAMDRARRALRDGKPITNDMFPTSNRFGELPFYSQPTYFDAVGRPPVDRTGELLSLRAALGAMDDETVGTSILATLGYKQLSWLFSAATAAGGAA